jgi:hypothetical protein
MIFAIANNSDHPYYFHSLRFLGLGIRFGRVIRHSDYHISSTKDTKNIEAPQYGTANVTLIP